MNNTLTSLNNYLFEQIERLNDDELDDAQFEKELQRSKAITDVADKVISNAKLQLDAIKTANEYGFDTGEKLPTMLEAK